MKKNILPAALSSLSCTVGILCLAVRYWLLTSGVDQKGLLIPTHPGNALSWALAAVTVVTVAAFVLWKRPRCTTDRSPLALLGGLCAMVAYGYMGIRLLFAGTVWHTASAVLSLGSALCLAVDTALRLKGQRPSALLRCAPVLFYAVFLLCNYQLWTSQTQLQSYGFQLLALIFLMLTAYHRAAMAEAKKGSRRYPAVSCCSLFFCLAAIPGASNGLFYLFMALSTLLDGCRQAKEKSE